MNKPDNPVKHYFLRQTVNRLFGRENYRLLKVVASVLCCKLNMPYELSRFFDLIVRKDDIVFDIGANLGQYLVRLSGRVGAEGRILGFEPVAGNYNLLLRLKETLRLKNVDLFQLALSNFTGEHELLIPVTADNVEIDTRSHLGIVKKTDELDGVRHRVEVVKVSTIDAVFESLKLKKIDIIKSDTEGHDSLVLEGGKNVISRFKPLIFVESSPEEAWLGPWCSLGYELFYVEEQSRFVVPVERARGAAVKKDLLVLMHKEDAYHHKFVVK